MTDRKDSIRSMIDAVVDGNEEQAEVDFHQAATATVRDIMGISTEVPEYTEVDTGAEGDEGAGDEGEANANADDGAEGAEQEEVDTEGAESD